MLVRHIPHASTLIPEDMKRFFLISSQEMRHELLRLTDWYTDELFSDCRSREVLFPVSRLVCDPERFLNDSEELASEVGMGVFYTHGTNGQVIRENDEALRREIIARYYQPHHQSLSACVAENLVNHEKCLILDCHSFPQERLPTDIAADGMPRPDICLGFEEFHYPADLVDEIFSGLSSEGLVVLINTPYSGSLIPSEYHNKDERVLGLMIELNRRIYMDENSGLKLDKFDQIRDLIKVHILDRIHSYLQN